MRQFSKDEGAAVRAVWQRKMQGELTDKPSMFCCTCDCTCVARWLKSLAIADHPAGIESVSRSSSQSLASHFAS